MISENIVKSQCGAVMRAGAVIRLNMVYVSIHICCTVLFCCIPSTATLRAVLTSLLIGGALLLGLTAPVTGSMFLSSVLAGACVIVNRASFSINDIPSPVPA